MWSLLSDPGHSKTIASFGDAYGPLQALVEQLARRPNANEVFAFSSLASFNLTTAPSYHEYRSDEIIGVDYIPNSGLFEVRYGKMNWNLPREFASERSCEAAEACEIIERYVLRLVISQQSDQ